MTRREPGAVASLGQARLPTTGRRVVMITAASVLLSCVGGPLEAQNPVEGTDWVARTLRPSGQPVIPAFEGWW